MSGPANIVEIEVILKAHCFANFKPPISTAHDEAIDRLLKADMIRVNQHDGSFTTTLRGQFWVNHLLTIPYPVESYAIPGE